MGLIAKLLGQPAKAAAGKRESRLAMRTRDQTRRELLARAVRDTLNKHGVPPDSIIADALAGSAQGQPEGVHLLLIFREWHPGLLPHLVSLEQALRSRLARIDPLSTTWLAGVLWRFQPVQPSQWPQLPALGQWASPRPASPHRSAARQDMEAVVERGDAAFSQRSGDGDDFSPTLPMERQPVQPVA